MTKIIDEFTDRDDLSYWKKWRLRHPDVPKQKQNPETTKLYRENNIESIQEYQRVYSKLPDVREARKNKRRNDPRHQMLSSAKSRAGKRGRAFDLSIDDIIIPDKCPILGIPLKVGVGKANNNSPTIDEVIPGLGYVRDNARVISHKANTMKQGNTIEDFELLIRYMKGEL